MSNKKVYLAKSVLAKGLDVEYVKSNLSRIKGIDIVEFGMGIDPSECAALVIVPDEMLSFDGTDTMGLGKRVSLDVDSFFECNDIDNVFVFIGRKEAAGDVETDTPQAYYGNEFDFHENNYDHHSDLVVDIYDQMDLLECISDIIDEPYDAWKRVPRHHQPAPEFAIPPVPTVEERKLKKSVTIEHSGSMNIRPATTSECYGKRRLLLRSRRK